MSDFQHAQLDWDENGQPLSRAFGDVYFSRHSGLNETRHVFLATNRLAERFAALGDGEVLCIGETGFGTGLNFLCAWQLFERVAPAGATRSNSCQAQRKFSPVPKPVSPMHSTSPSPSAAKRSARRLVARNTWRVSLSPECREKYTSPKARDSGWPFSSQSSWACWKSDMAEPEKADGAFYGALPASGEALREHAAAPRRQPHADPLP
ncbi:hypothetical protein FA370_15245 [Pseudomonas aeruginosa]|nr:hypothetical protein [Pseudomonas aeruginosa]